jgi:hypothetical protein
MRIIRFTLVLLVTVSVFSQQNIENPEKPRNKNSGKQILLEEIFRVNDESGEYFFKYPHNLKVASDGTLFVQDDRQLLQFNLNGDFVLNFFESGQGPGEMLYVENYWLDDEYIIINHYRPNKIIWMDYEGEFVKEFRIEQETRILQLLLYSNDVYYFCKSDYMNYQGEPGYKEIPWRIYSLSKNGEELKELISVPIQCFVVRVGGSGGFVGINKFITVPYKKKYIFISHTSDYLLKLYDLEANQIDQVFRRKYHKVKTPPERKKRGKGSLTINGKRYEVPHPNYMEDVRALQIYKDKLWVITSTIDKKKGFLVDEFTHDGIYENNYYLKFPGETTYSSSYTILVSGDYLYRVIRNESELYEIIKYRIGF